MKVASPVPHKRARIEIIPLIDIMFFLLASFMMVSLSQTHMKGIRVNLPAAIAPPPSQVRDYVSIKIQRETRFTSTTNMCRMIRSCRAFLSSIAQIQR